jgi:poly(A) polymerase
VEPAGRIAPPPWMTTPAARAGLAALTAAGAPARFVGGCVRDAVLGREVKDVDVATPEPPDRVTTLLGAAGIRVVPTGLDHGTVTALAGDARFEVTTLRRDVETYGRRARVAFTDDWAADAARRDFTINALFADPDGTLYDPTGGLADLGRHRVRFVGDARTRIAEDVLRLLRFFRFYAWYGKPPPDRAALAACRAMADRLPTLSAERVWAELKRLLEAPDPGPAVGLMVAQHVAPHVLPGTPDVARLGRLVAIEAALGRAGEPIRRLASLLTVGAEEASALADRLRLANVERDRLAEMTARRGALRPSRDARAARRALYKMGAEAYRDTILLSWAAAGAAPAHRGWRALWRAADRWTAPRLPVAGADVLALGVPKGPRVGKLLREVEAWWIERDFQPGRAACLRRLKALAGVAA